MNANVTSVKAAKSSIGCFGSGMPNAIASASCSRPAVMSATYRAATVLPTSAPVETGVSR